MSSDNLPYLFRVGMTVIRLMYQCISVNCDQTVCVYLYNFIILHILYCIQIVVKCSIHKNIGKQAAGISELSL